MYSASHIRCSSTVATVALLDILAGCDESSVPTIPQAPVAPELITNGVPTGSDQYSNVGALLFDFTGDGIVEGNEFFCSGSLIAPTVFLTAAHCLVFLPPDAQIYVTFDASLVPAPGQLIAAEAFHFDPDFGHDQANLHDLGVVILPESSTEGIAPLQLPPAGYLDERAAKGGLRDQLFVNVGYGVSAARTGKPRFDFDGERKMSKSPFMALQPNWLGLLMNSRATGEGGSCFGDSGSPKFVDGSPAMIVAVTTGGNRVCRSLNYNYRLDTSSARAFLGQFVALP